MIIHKKSNNSIPYFQRRYEISNIYEKDDMDRTMV